MSWLDTIFNRQANRKEPNASAQRAEQDIRGRFNPIRQLEPANLSRWIDEFEAGNLRPLARLLDALSERDDVWKAAQRKTIRSVARCKWDVAIVDGHEKDPEAQKHFDALVDFYSTLRATALLKRTHVGGVAHLVRQMMLAERDAYSTHELVWRVENGKLRCTAVHVPLWMFENRTGNLRFLESAFGLEGKPLLPGEWLTHCGDGIGIACAICATYKRLSLSDWLAYSEHNATPGLHTKTPAKIGSPEWQKAVEATRSFAKEWAIVTGSDVQIGKIDLGASGTLPYQTFIEMMNRGMAALWRGADLSTISADSQGASLQDKEMEMLEQGAAEDIAETNREQLDRFVLNWYFGDVPRLAEFRLLPVSRPNVDQEIKINEHLAKHGARIPIADELSRFGRRAVDAQNPDDEPMKAPEAAPAPGGFALGNETTAADPDGAAFASAVAKDLAPIAKRMDELLKEEAGDLKAAAKRLLDELPELAKKALADPAAALIIEKSMRKAAGLEENGALANAGTSDGARKGWETRRRNGWTPSQFEENQAKIVDMFRKRNEPGNRVEVLGTINREVADDIHRANPAIDAEGAEQVVDSRLFRHADDRHGERRREKGRSLGETDESQIPLAEEDYRRLPDVLADYDAIESGSSTRHEGAPSIVYRKKFGDGTIYYVEYAQVNTGGKRQMAGKTMWKKRTEGGGK